MTAADALLSFFLGLAAFALAEVGKRLARRYRHPDDQARWSEELRVDIYDAADAYLRAGEAHARIAAKLEHMPREFVAPVFQALELGPALERAVIAEATKRGLSWPGQFSGTGPAVVAKPEPVGDGVAPMPAPVTASNVVRLEAGPDGRMRPAGKQRQ